MSAETINPKVWSLSAETYSDLSAEIFADSDVFVLIVMVGN